MHVDCSHSFHAAFIGVSFKNQKDFYDALRNFELGTGTQYIRTSRQLHIAGTIERTLFDFKHAQFTCVKYGAGIRRGSRKHSPTGCTAKFSVTSTGGSLRILKYAMLHNHPPEPVTEDFRQSLMSNETLSDQTLIAVASGIDDELVMADLTNEFLGIFGNRFFYSCHELLYHMNEFMKSTGCNYVMRNTVRFPVGSPLTDKLVYRSVAFECFHFGTYTSYATVRRKQRTAKIGCRSKIYFLCKNNRLQVGRYQLKHNHEVNPGNPVSELRIPDGKNRKRRAISVNYNMEKPEHTFPECYLEEYVALDPENAGFDHHDDDSVWMDTSGADSHFSLAVDSSRVVDHICTDVLLSHVERSISNLKSIATSGGPDRLLSCLQDLQELEKKWEQEIGLEDNAVEEVSFGVSDDFSSEEVQDISSARRSAGFPSLRRVDPQDFSPLSIPQPRRLEYLDDQDSTRTWYHEGRM